MPNGHKRERTDPTTSFALRKERNKRYYASREAAKQLLTLAADAESQTAPTIDPPTTAPTEAPTTRPNDSSPAATRSLEVHETCGNDPTASLALRKECNKRYYASCKAAGQLRYDALNDEPHIASETNPTPTAPAERSTPQPSDSTPPATSALGFQKTLPPLKRVTSGLKFPMVAGAQTVGENGYPERVAHLVSQCANPPKMPNGHKRERTDPATSRALRKERNKRYHASRKAAEQLLTLAAEQLLTLASSAESQTAPTIDPPTTAPTKAPASRELRKEHNKRYYASRKAAKQLLTLAANTESQTTPTIDPPTTAPTDSPTTRPNDSPPAATQSLEVHATCGKDRTASRLLRKERNKRYYASRKAARQLRNATLNHEPHIASETIPTPTAPAERSTPQPSDSTPPATSSPGFQKTLPPRKPAASRLRFPMDWIWMKDEMKVAQ